jgi:hypothetical protein
MKRKRETRNKKRETRNEKKNAGKNVEETIKLTEFRSRINNLNIECLIL